MRINKAIFDLLQFRRSPAAATRELAKLGHNDSLLPVLQRKIEEVALAFNKYHRITYDIQGLRDRGADVVFRQTNDEDDYVCFQVKSDSDIQESEYLQKLKSQYFYFRNQYPRSSDYFIMLGSVPGRGVTGSG